MLRKYCLETGKSWDGGVPFMLFVAREARQESLCFSPAELVFGHTPRGPLRALKERILLLSAESADTTVVHYDTHFRECLFRANAVAKQCLTRSLVGMKKTLWPDRHEARVSNQG